MIKANELRIGNAVERRGETGTVYSINPEDIWVKFGAEYGDTELWYYADVEPILLTTEILEKCGFEELSSAWWRKDIFKILMGWTDEAGDFWHLCDIEENVLTGAYHYVHQLQNLYFALTGEEVEIKL